MGQVGDVVPKALKNERLYPSLQIVLRLPIQYTSLLSMVPKPAGNILESGLDLRPPLAVFSKSCPEPLPTFTDWE